MRKFAENASSIYIYGFIKTHIYLYPIYNSNKLTKRVIQNIKTFTITILTFENN